VPPFTLNHLIFSASLNDFAKFFTALALTSGEREELKELLFNVSVCGLSPDEGRFTLKAVFDCCAPVV